MLMIIGHITTFKRLTVDFGFTAPNLMNPLMLLTNTVVSHLCEVN